jgi:fibronectin type 3 domain-containing protein
LVIASRSFDRVQLAWKDNSDTETMFKIERSTDGKTFYPLGAAGANFTVYTNTGVTSGRRYWYRVYAINASGASTMSNVAEVAVPFATAVSASAPGPATVFSTKRVSGQRALFA